MTATLTDRAACECHALRQDLWQCEHFRIFNKGKRLTSVGRIISATFGNEPCACGGIGYNHKPGCQVGERTENARERGAEMDQIFAEWLRGKLSAVPVGVREDAKALFKKLTAWFNRQTFSSVEVQVVLGAEDHGGVVDLILDGVVTDLKATYSVEHTHRLQVAAYAGLHHADGQILHVTERYAEPRLVPLKQEDYDDWRILRDCWRMSVRRSKKVLE